MKVVLNISREVLDELDLWHPCEGLKLRERDDGSLELLVTPDLAQSERADIDAAAAVARLRGLAAR